MEKKIFTIINIIHCGTSIKSFTFSPDDGKNIAFNVGQFAQLFQLENGNFGKLSRPYSIASSPYNKELRFVIKITGGQFTSILDKMKIGEKLGVAGPFGHFVYKGESKVIFIAAGTGVAPILGMLEYIAQEKKDGKFTLFYSNKKQEWVACTELLETFRNQNPSIKIVYTLTRQTPNGWLNELGRINEKMIIKYVDYSKDAVVFICGSMEFVKSMKEIMIKLGTNEKKIKTEAWK